MNTCEKASGTQPSNLLSAVTPPQSPGQSAGALSQPAPLQPAGLAQVGLVKRGTTASMPFDMHLGLPHLNNLEQDGQDKARNNPGALRHSIRHEGHLPRTH